jgi:transposase
MPASENLHNSGHSKLHAKRRKNARVDDRNILNAIFYVLRTGMPWRDLTVRYGPLHHGP